MKDIKSEPLEMLQISSKINTNKMIPRKMIINLMKIKGKILKMREMHCFAITDRAKLY